MSEKDLMKPSTIRSQTKYWHPMFPIANPKDPIAIFNEILGGANVQAAIVPKYLCRPAACRAHSSERWS